MGFYVNDPNTGFVFVDNTGGNSPGVYGSSFVKWEVHYDGGLPAGPWQFNTWIATDSLPNVMHDIDQLYAWGLLSRCPPSSLHSFFPDLFATTFFAATAVAGTAFFTAAIVFFLSAQRFPRAS
jgi:hypothetical protein